MAWDVFFSYPTADGKAAGKLRDRLVNAGLSVFRDREGVPDTASITRSITEGLANSRLLVAWYSDAYSRSRACQWELTAACLAGEAEGNRCGRLMVVNPLPEREHVPALLRDSLVVPGGDDAALDEAVRRIQHHLSTPRTTLGSITSLAGGNWHGNARMSAPRFVGRITEMWDVHGILMADRPQAAILNSGEAAAGLVHGLGGIGKSLMAEEYGRRFAAAYPGGLMWLSATTGDRDTQLLSLGVRLGLPVEGEKPGRVAALLQEHLTAQKRYLWIVDDLPSDSDPDALRPWLAPSANGRTLVTSRGTRLAGCGKAVPLGALSDAEALALLTSRRPPRDDAERTAAAALVEALGGHPLALDVAGAAVKHMGYARTLDDTLDRSQEVLSLAAKLSEDLPTNHDRSITATLLHSLGRLNAGGLRLLQLAAVLATAPIPLDLLTRAWGDDGAALLALDNAFRESLVDRPDGDVFVHALVSRVVPLLAPPPDELRAAAVRVLNAVMPAAKDIRNHARLSDWLPHAEAVTAGAEDAATLALLLWLWWHDYVRGNYAAAAVLGRRCWDGRRRVLGAEHSDTLTALGNLAETLRAQGDHAGARALHEQVLFLRRRVLGTEHPATLMSMGNLANTLREQGDYVGARSLHEQVVEAHRRVLGAEHPDTLTSMNNLALTLWVQGDHAGARALDEQVLEARRRVQGAEHPDTLTSMNNLAGTLRDQDDHVGARALLEQVVEAHCRVLGAEHPATLTLMGNLASTLAAQGDHAGARALKEQVLSLRRRVLGDDHPNTITAMGNLAVTVAALGDIPAARALVDEAVARSRAKLGDGHPTTQALLAYSRKLAGR